MPKRTRGGEGQNYQVGYGRPPTYSRFQPGHSGNPKGRPKGRKSLAQMLEEQLSARVTVTVAGRTQSITRREALIYGMIGDALKGKDRVRKQLLDLMLVLDTQADNKEQEEAPVLEDDARIIQAFLQRNRNILPPRPQKTGAEPSKSATAPAKTTKLARPTPNAHNR